MARWSMRLRRSPSVMLKALAVPARNAATLGKLNRPVPSAKLSLMKCRYSPPSFMEWRPLARRHRVVEHVGRVVAALRQRCRSAEVERAGDDHLRQSNRPRDAVPDPEVDRVERRRRKRSAVETRPAEARFVQERRSEHVRLVDRQHVLSTARDVDPNPGMLLPCDVGSAPRTAGGRRTAWRRSLPAGVVLKIDRPAILIDDGRRRPTNRGVPSASKKFARGISGISCRMTGSVAAARCSSLSTRLFMSTPWRCLKPFVEREEERAATPDRAAQRAAELVAA